MKTSTILDGCRPICVASGFVFTEGPLWDPEGAFYFADVKDNKLFKIIPGEQAELVRHTESGNGTTFDLSGKLVQCEGRTRRLTRWDRDEGTVDVVIDNIDGKKLNRPNDVICRSDGSLLFSDPDKLVDIANRELDAGIWRVDRDGATHLVAHCEYPNGLAYSIDERKLYVANTRWLKYLHEITFDSAGRVCGRKIIADMSGNDLPGVPDGVKVDQLGRIFCTGPGGIWVLTEDGKHIETITCPERAVNFAFGGTDLRTLYICAQTSVYTVRTKVPGIPSPWHQHWAALHGHKNLLI